jgi:hypothetical protein
MPVNVSSGITSSVGSSDSALGTWGRSRIRVKKETLQRPEWLWGVERSSQFFPSHTCVFYPLPSRELPSIYRHRTARDRARVQQDWYDERRQPESLARSQCVHYPTLLALTRSPRVGVPGSPTGFVTDGQLAPTTCTGSAVSTGVDSECLTPTRWW